ncbi:MAG: extracellular solute-binding protein [Patescibacteria group bacterium]
MIRQCIAILLLPLLLVGAGCLSGSQPTLKKINLTYWRIQDEPDALAASVAAYGKLHPNITIDVKKFREEDYERMLLEALAEKRGPDMFSIPNTWLRGWQKKLLPAPKETTITTQTVNAQRQIAVVNQKSPAITFRDLTIGCVEAVSKDVIFKTIAEPEATPPVKAEDKIWGLPLSVDTLAMYVNRDLLKKANIEKPAVTWTELRDQTIKLTIRQDNAIKQSGAALGLADNIKYLTDIMAALMMQNGAVMADDSGYPKFHVFPADRGDAEFPPGVEAYLFYKSFSTPGSVNHSWDAALPNSLDAFVTGRTAIFFGFPADAAVIQARAPKLDFEVAKLPQIDPGKVFNVADYPVEVVSKQTAHPDESWDFIQFIARPEQVAAYLQKTRRPTALRALIASQLTAPDVAPFADQLLTAKSWYRGKDYAKAQAAFSEMINFVPLELDPKYGDIVGRAAAKVGDTLR